MATVFEQRATAGAVRLSTRWEREVWQNNLQTKSSEGRESRRQTTFSQRSRNSMRYLFSGLPWVMLGERVALVTLTYPAKWRAVAEDARAVVRQRKAFEMRWRRRWGDLFGVWIMEFQPRLRRPAEERQAPHIHMYVKLPDEVSDDEYRGFQRRTLDRRRREKEVGKYAARGGVKPLDGVFGGWLLRSWFEIVGSNDPKHRRRGGDITTAFWSDEAEANADRVRIAEYFWEESGKKGQKQPPEDFGSLAFYGVWGGAEGFKLKEEVSALERDVFVRSRRVYRRLMEIKMHRKYRQRGKQMKGLTVYIPEAKEVVERVEKWALSMARSEL